MKRFAFVANLIERGDVRLKEFYPLLSKFIPLIFWEVILLIKAFFFKGFRVTAIYRTKKVVGATVICELTPRLMVSRYTAWLARRVVLKACLFAQKNLQVEVIGLGSLTKSITESGLYLKRMGVTVPITHGNTYSVASAYSGIRIFEKQFASAFQGKPSVAVIGAYGTIGEALTQLLIERGYSVIAMGRKIEQLNKLAAFGAKVTTDLTEAMEKSDIAVMATSAPYSILSPSNLKREKTYFVYDIGQPPNLSPKSYWDLIKQGYSIVRADGGFEGADAEDVDIYFWMRLPKGYMYACFVELIMQTLEGDFQDHLGHIDVGHVERTLGWASKWGFSHQALTCFGKPLKEVLEEAVEKRPKRIQMNCGSVVEVEDGTVEMCDDGSIKVNASTVVRIIPPGESCGCEHLVKSKMPTFASDLARVISML